MEKKKVIISGKKKSQGEDLTVHDTFSSDGSKLTEGQRNMLSVFRGQLRSTNWLRRHVESGQTIYGPDLDEMGMYRELTDPELDFYLKMGSRHAFDLYRDLSTDPKAKAKADAILADEKARDERKRRKTAVSPAMKGKNQEPERDVILSDGYINSFDRQSWNPVLDPTKGRRKDKK